jgi:hypothetical protein
VIDTTTETVLPFSRAARHVPSIRAGRPVSPATLWRWSSAGCVGRDGQRVKLETIRIGCSTCTSIEALDRFFRRLSGEEVTQPAIRPTSKAHQKAVTELEKAGIA